MHANRTDNDWFLLCSLLIEYKRRMHELCAFPKQDNNSQVLAIRTVIACFSFIDEHIVCLCAVCVVLTCALWYVFQVWWNTKSMSWLMTKYECSMKSKCYCKGLANCSAMNYLGGTVRWVCSGSRLISGMFAWFAVIAFLCTCSELLLSTVRCRFLCNVISSLCIGMSGTPFQGCHDMWRLIITYCSFFNIQDVWSGWNKTTCEVWSHAHPACCLQLLIILHDVVPLWSK